MKKDIQERDRTEDKNRATEFEYGTPKPRPEWQLGKGNLHVAKTGECTSTFECRADVRDFQLVHRFFEGKGFAVPTRAATLRMCVEMVAAIAQESGLEVEDDPEMALEYLWDRRLLRAKEYKSASRGFNRLAKQMHGIAKQMDRQAGRLGGNFTPSQPEPSAELRKMFEDFNKSQPAPIKAAELTPEQRAAYGIVDDPEE